MWVSGSVRMRRRVILQVDTRHNVKLSPVVVYLWLPPTGVVLGRRYSGKTLLEVHLLHRALEIHLVNPEDMTKEALITGLEK